MAAFYDSLNVKRHGSELGKFRKLVLNDQEAVPTMDGDAHRTRKAYLLAAHTSEWIDGYLKESAEFQEKLVVLIKEAAAGAGVEGKVALFPIILKTYIKMLAKVWFGLEAGDEYVANFLALSAGFQAPLPIDLPGTTYRAGIVARDALFATYADQLAKHRKNPDAYKHTALSALLAKQQEYELSDLMMLTELHHFVFASSGLMAPVLCAALMGLGTNPEALARARAEADAHADLLSSASTADIGNQLPFLAWTIKEATRKYAFIPIQLGLANREFEVDGYTIPSGTFLIAGLHATDMDPAIWTAPEKFDPARYERGEGLGDFDHVPFGAGNKAQTHRCPGGPAAASMSTVILGRLLLEFDFGLEAGQDQVPKGPLPANGLPVKITSRRA
ncbi:cytochrome P450 [Blyttiomyces helicus]|uniref:Cytochrome P450 n=1 Tax=Blyttiomyces helicus TaxID=388810 RepID=A0A4P9W9B4_9FUNG|nr:cytochrome P450 [Blyttiomyces helicus]|eukprot:RKO89139.1 cytochrome P450 [Blyttiomyces helicus]